MSKHRTYNFDFLTIFGFLQLSTYLLRKQAATAAAEDVNHREEAEEEKEKEGEEEEKDFISNSGQRPRHAVENNQNLSLSCHKKRESLAMFSQFLTPWADKSSGVKKPMSDTGRQIHHNTARERIHNTTPVSRSTHQHWFCLRAEVPQIQVEGRCASHRVSEASPPCLGWRRYASGHSHHPREF